MVHASNLTINVRGNGMAKYRQSLPQMMSDIFLTDGGLETTLVFHHGIDLPFFSTARLLESDGGEKILFDYYERHVRIARSKGVGFILESATWRTSSDWGRKLGYEPSALARINRRAIDLMVEVRQRYETPQTPMVVSGCVGPRGDGYRPEAIMSEREAAAYHAEQIATFADTAADMIAAITMTNTNEAIGIARAARASGMPAAISFTVETDGRLPTGQTLSEAIRTVDAATNGAPAYYMVNCAHPTHFEHILLADDPALARLRGVRANASRCSHAELDESTELDDGNPAELGEQYRAIRARHPQITVLGGCCGTDHRHVEAIAEACAGTPLSSGPGAVAAA
jgi:S-methylmethionine-dependent homocysteine/selenocysteine methylase